MGIAVGGFGGMAQIVFKTKVKNRYNADGSIAYSMVDVPMLKRAHCDMGAFRSHPKFGGLTNSDMFPNVLARIRRDVFGGKDYMRIDKTPQNVTIDMTGFLAVVVIEV